MAINIKGIRLDSLSLNFVESGEDKIQGQYSLISSSDKVVAKQAFNGYGTMKLAPTSETMLLMDKFIQSYKQDIEALLGLS